MAERGRHHLGAPEKIAKHLTLERHGRMVCRCRNWRGEVKVFP
jgi:hypothetical protein